MAIMSMWTRLQPRYASNMWNEALNKRLGTEVHINVIAHHTWADGDLMFLQFVSNM